MKIQLNNLGKRFGSKWLFEGIDFEFETGTIYALSGHNGSGKSTLLKLLAGYAKPSKGTIAWFDDEPVSVISTENIYQKVCFTAPYIKLIEDFTLFETIIFHNSFKPLTNSLSIPNFATTIQLMNEIYNPLNQFSLGMMQRVKLGLALLTQSPIVLLDEPTSNLDKEGKKWFFDLLHKISPDTLLIMASNEDEEIAHADKVLCLETNH